MFLLAQSRILSTKNTEKEQIENVSFNDRVPSFKATFSLEISSLHHSRFRKIDLILFEAHV